MTLARGGLAAPGCQRHHALVMRATDTPVDAWSYTFAAAALTAAACAGLGCDDMSANSPAQRELPPASAAPAVASGVPAASASTTAAAPTASAVASSTAHSAAGSVAGGRPCGALECRHFDDARAAFSAVLALKPQVLAVGEAHAQQGSEKVPSATRRFSETLLPLTKGAASDLVLELMVADGSCKQTQQKVAQVQKPVVQKQAQGNQNEFTALGHAAKALAIRPHVLRPSCDDYQRVVKAGPDGIDAMLTMIGALSGDLLKRILERNAREQRDKLILAYGGAIHNDASPREGREKWSFGPAMAAATEGHYIELDIIVPEFIKDNDTWRRLPWHEHFKPQLAPDMVTLYRTGPHSFTLIFARSPVPPPVPAVQSP